jgi:lysophospholipase L1-like esterase
MTLPCIARFAPVVALVMIASPLATAEPVEVAHNLQLTLPRQAQVAVGTPWSIYFDNIVLTESPEDYHYEIQCEIGNTEQRRWTVSATTDQIGDHKWVIYVKDSSGVKIATGAMLLRVLPPFTGDTDPFRILFVGDSLTHASQYPNEVARLLDQFEMSKWEMLGTHRPNSAADRVAHEGYGGWTWQRFVEKYEPNPDGTHRKRSSPFVFLVDGNPELDVARYFQENCRGARPDVVFFLLGINDCFSANPDSPQAIDDRITKMLDHADRLLSEFRRAAPQADLAICLTTPPNARESGFEANYKGRYHRWGWKRIQHRIVQRLLEHFGEKEAEQLFVVPTQLNLDPVEGYSDNNGVHPNTVGYQQIGVTIYGWLCTQEQ